MLNGHPLYAMCSVQLLAGWRVLLYCVVSPLRAGARVLLGQINCPELLVVQDWRDTKVSSPVTPAAAAFATEQTAIVAGHQVKSDNKAVACKN